jgi:hypothetical protein
LLAPPPPPIAVRLPKAEFWPLLALLVELTAAAAPPPPTVTAIPLSGVTENAEL